MEKRNQKNALKALLLLIISELFCFSLTRFSISSYDMENIYDLSLIIVQILYFIPTLVVYVLFLFYPKSDKTLAILSTIGLIIYSIILHFAITPIVSLFIKVLGILNFVEYSAKIYLLTLPLLGFKMLLFQKIIFRKTFYFWITLQTFILLFTTIVFNHIFSLKGVLYSWPFCEFAVFLIMQINFLTKKLEN